MPILHYNPVYSKNHYYHNYKIYSLLQLEHMLLVQYYHLHKYHNYLKLLYSLTPVYKLLGHNYLLAETLIINPVYKLEPYTSSHYLKLLYSLLQSEYMLLVQYYYTSITISKAAEPFIITILSTCY